MELTAKKYIQIKIFTDKIKDTKLVFKQSLNI